MDELIPVCPDCGADMRKLGDEWGWVCSVPLCELWTRMGY